VIVSLPVEGETVDQLSATVPAPPVGVDAAGVLSMPMLAVALPEPGAEK
jgi:hypothetical protein